MRVTPDAIRQLLDELEANRKSRKTAWATLQRLRKFLEENGARIGMPDDRNFEAEGEANRVLSTSSSRRKSCAIQKELTPEKI